MCPEPSDKSWQSSSGWENPSLWLAAQETMGVDWTLIEDGTYFVIEADQQGGNAKEDQGDSV